MASFQFSKDKLPKQLVINNEYVDSKNSKKLTVNNPKDGSLVADDVPLAGEADVDAAVAAAEAAFPAWKATTPTKRRDMLNKLADLIDAHAKPLAELTRITLGAPWGSFGSFEMTLCAETFRYNAGWTDKFAGESHPQEDGFMKIVRNEPLGVTAGIIPWNGPVGSIGLKAGPALATGNCFILKPSEKTPFAALAFLPLIKEAGFPPGVFQVLSGDGSTGALLASHMRVRKVSFTGSIPTGKKIQEMAAKSNLKRVTLELGGKSPAVVFDDANLENAVTWTVNAITGHSGQVCFAASRVYVQEGIYEKFIEKYKTMFMERTKTAGDPDAESTIFGPLVDQAQFDRVTGFIQRGKEQNQGTLLTGGARIGDKGYFVEPTIFTDVKEDAEIHRDEIFGPVSVVRTFKTEEEVMKISNDTDNFDSGMVGINCISLMMTQAPFGGSKQSGIGREAGIAALRAFTDTKTIMVNLTY
ncbi:uncharacterized protein LTR77_005753 [Saxophila tyrrhenica]|uniref:aldehyde dehydrogenase (NAD(+)) n=1 Tax=Saxophila tyrrhenica TaxID=1690608 RepID=A0AAV9PDI9_9PEZI|nr:hypothetical protein LTR77_005753 [Saxophila tyrrhenica]